jgi:hypothetical protein
MGDDMMMSGDSRSLRRGKRRAPRTETCRPCLVWPKDVPDMMFQGVITNVTPYGMCIRMLDSLPQGTLVMVQLMRDEEFRYPLSAPVEGMIVRNAEEEVGFMDHGVQLLRKALERPPNRPTVLPAKHATTSRNARTRMHTIDLHVTDRGIRRNER